ncbi:MAG: CAP domain-containing protein [Treponema sp.]|nr:CAP domain-containing protein [Treponema sp.]
MRKFFRILLLSAFVVFYSCSNGATAADDNDDYDDIVDVEVMNCFNAINNFRTSDTWLWDESGTTQVPVTGLSAFVLDKDLCKVAQLRANELLIDFSHTRPNGQICYTAYQDAGVSLSPRGECAGAGLPSGEWVAELFFEEIRFNFQGHRRLLLDSDATKIGIAYAYSPNSQCYYWIVEIAR